MIRRKSRRSKKGVAAICLMMISMCLTACGDKQTENPYGAIVAGLGDDGAYAFLEMDYQNNVLVTTDLIYDEGSEGQASIACDVYYIVDGEAKKLGTVMSAGTAYPISFSESGIFAGSGHSVEKYAISEKEGSLFLEKGAYERFDESGNATYIIASGGKESESTEEEYGKLVEEYAASQIVHFSYGAAGSVNELIAKPPFL